MVEQCERRATHSVCPQSILIKSQASAELFLASMQRDPAAVSAVRSLMWTNGHGAGYRFTANAALKWMANQLVSGRVRICDQSGSTSAPIKADPGTTTASAAAVAAAQSDKPFPVAARSQQNAQNSVVPPSEQSAFPADVQLTELAQTLKNAAQSGVPFCEECLRAAQGG